MVSFIDNAPPYSWWRRSGSQQGGVGRVPRHLRPAQRCAADGSLLVDGKTRTNFANSEEQFADSFVGQKIQPFWIEDEARKLPNTNFNRPLALPRICAATAGWSPASSSSRARRLHRLTIEALCL